MGSKITNYNSNTNSSVNSNSNSDGNSPEPKAYSNYNIDIIENTHSNFELVKLLSIREFDTADLINTEEIEDDSAYR